MRGRNAPMTNGALDEGFAGLPHAPQSTGVMTAGTLQGAAQAPNVPLHRGKPYKRFTLPKELVGAEWGKSNFSDADLAFGMTEITTQQRLRASKLAGGAKMDFQAVSLEQTYQCIYTIGGKLTNNNRSVIQAWFHAIGPKGQDVVERIFSEMTSATESDVQAVMAGGSWDEG